MERGDEGIEVLWLFGAGDDTEHEGIFCLSSGLRIEDIDEDGQGPRGNGCP
jgi:hypothetical protein